MNAVGLDDYVDRRITARWHPQVVEIDPHVVQATGRRKLVYAPGASRQLAINDDGRRARVKNKRQREKTRLDLNAGPGLWCGHVRLPHLGLRRSCVGFSRRRLPAQHWLARGGGFIQTADAS